MIDSVYQVVELARDTVFVSVLESHLTDLKPENTIELKFIWGAAGTIIGSIIGALVTIWMKKKEFQNFKENLNLQKQILEENKVNNEYQIKAEIIRLKDLRKQYELSLKKFDFDHLKELLEFADDKNEKVAMLKDFTSILSKFNPEIPAWVEDYHEYQLIVVDHTYYRLEDIEKDIKGLLEKHVATFASLHKNFKEVSSQANYLIRQKAQFTMDMNEMEDEYIIDQLFKSLFKLYEDYNKLLDLLQEEFRELDKVKRGFILERSKK
jgi:hypothetical protein